MIGLVARYRNEAIYGQDVRAIKGARAHLKLFDKSGQEIGTGFSAALWLGEARDAFDLIPNGRGGSVLVCWGSKAKAYVRWKTRVAVDRLRDNQIELGGYPASAEVTILDSNDRPLIEPVVLEITKAEGELSVAVRRPGVLAEAAAFCCHILPCFCGMILCNRGPKVGAGSKGTANVRV
jgi:hypothetical protein